jgi:hypothetical protein
MGVIQSYTQPPTVGAGVRVGVGLGVGLQLGELGIRVRERERERERVRGGAVRERVRERVRVRLRRLRAARLHCVVVALAPGRRVVGAGRGMRFRVSEKRRGGYGEAAGQV